MNRFEIIEDEFDGYVDTRGFDFATAFFVGVAILAFLTLVIHSFA